MSSSESDGTPLNKAALHQAAQNQAALHQAAQWLASSRKTIAFTGAGVSTESGIPDFRSAEGLWARFDPAEYATLGAFRADPEKVWRMLAELETVLEAQPNAGHLAMARLEAGGALKGIVTQNIDGLHQAAGSSRVVEFHGSGRSFTCLSCGANTPRNQVKMMGMPPRCEAGAPGEPCGAILKPDVVFFDEAIPPAAIAQAAELVKDAELVLVAGTSCEVFPASDIPRRVRGQGGRVIELNLEPAAALAPDILLQGRFGEIMPKLTAPLGGTAGMSPHRTAIALTEALTRALARALTEALTEGLSRRSNRGIDWGLCWRINRGIDWGLCWRINLT